MNKNIEWLKGRFAGRKIFSPLNDREIGYNEAIEEFSKYVDQLDEPEVLSQEFIDEYSYNIEEYWEVADMMDRPQYAVSVENLQKNLLVPKQELPAIPKFVADWIESNKEFEEKWNDYSKEDAMNDTIHFTIYGLFADYPATNSDVELRKPVIKWLSVDRGNYFKLVNSVRYGYEVEEEQKYYVDLETAAYVAKWVGDGSVQIYTDSISGSEEYELYLTEQEIKDYDERFWPFRKPVEEVEE